MIIKALLSIVLAVINVLLLPLSFLNFPTSFLSVLADVIVYIRQGFQIIAFYTDFIYLLDLLAIALAVDGLLMTYHFIMFILRKIPFLNIR